MTATGALKRGGGWSPSLGVVLGLSLAFIVFAVALGRLVVLDRAEARAAEPGLAQYLTRQSSLTAAALNDERTRVFLGAEAVSGAPALEDAVKVRDSARALSALQAERRSGNPVDLAAVDSGGHLLAAVPATNLPLGTMWPVRRALEGRPTSGTVDDSGALVLIGAAPIRQGGSVIGVAVAVRRLDDSLLNSLTRYTGLSAALVSSGRVIAATSAVRARYSQARDKTLQITPSNPTQPGHLRIGDATFVVASQALPAFAIGGHDTTLFVGRIQSEGVVGARSGLDLASAALAGLLAGFLGWLLGRGLGGSILTLATVSTDPPVLAGSETRALAALLARERAAAEARADDARADAGRLRVVLDAIGEGIIVSDSERRVILTNRAARSLLGLNGNGEPGAVISYLPPPEASAEIRANARILRSYSAPMAAGATGLTGVVTVLHDATAERESERVRGEFLSMVSHELQTPLTAVAGAADLLLDEPEGLSAQQTRFLNTIHRNADRLIALVSDLLDVSRLEAGRVELDLQPVDLDSVIRSTVRIMANLFEGKSQTLAVDLPDPDGPVVPPVLGDRRRLEQILANLLGNASQYTQPGGRVAVGLRRVGDAVVLSVSDDGPGISAADLPNVFEKFYRGSSAAQRRERGSGLGLAIVRSLVELHRGRVWVESAGVGGVERGTRINVALPIAAEEE